MTSTVQTITRKVVHRNVTDLDPKVAILAVIVVVCDLVLLFLFLTGRITAATFEAGVGPSGVGTVAAYLKTSSHAALVEKGEQILMEADQLAPVVEAIAPQTQPVIETAEDIVSALAPAIDPVPVSATTETLAVTAARPATAGGQ